MGIYQHVHKEETQNTAFTSTHLLKLRPCHSGNNAILAT